MKKLFQPIIASVAGVVLGVFVGTLIVQQFIHHNFLADLRNTLAPCSKPITYSIGTFDTKFGISEKTFLDSIDTAVQIWDKPIQKQLFVYDPAGSLKINLVYDYRQQATQTLKAMGITIHDDQATYDTIKKKYDAMQITYARKKTAYETELARYNQKKQAYETDATYWNTRGGAPQQEFDKLNAEKAALQLEANTLERSRLDLNAQVDDINALVVVMNRLISELNLAVKQYNSVGASAGKEFDEGIYKSDASGQEIDIYQFDSTLKLVKVLAHELGHALGLPHVDDAAAIMYRLNQGTNEVLTADDLAALKTQCHLK